MPFRPLFHYTPRANWMNDPNGLVWFAGEWHLFYQYNPEGDQWGNMSWGHAVSPDLVTWTELPVALGVDDAHAIFSGSIVVDWDNSAGVGTGDAPPLIALYTGHAHDGSRQQQCLAWSHDRGRTWVKSDRNPVLCCGLPDFRDPKVMRVRDHWVMVVALSRAQAVAIYTSPNLHDWTETARLDADGLAGTVWECPDLFELPVEGEAGSTAWVLKVDVMETDHPGRSVAYALTGQFDGQTFRADRDAAGAAAWQRIDHGHDFYAAMSWSDVPADDGRRVWIAWMSNHHYARETPTGAWRGAMTVPRALALRRDGARALRLVQRPVAELATLRAPLAIADGRFGGGAMAIELALTCDDAAFAVMVEAGGHRLAVRGDNGSLSITRDPGAMAPHPVFAAPATAAVTVRNATILIDRTSVEVFANDGAVVMTMQHFLPPGDWSAQVIGAAVSGWRLQPASR